MPVLRHEAAQLAAATEPAITPAGSGWVALATAGLLALLGGTLLNPMPCVLPVLSIKSFGLAESAAHDRRSARRLPPSSSRRHGPG